MGRSLRAITTSNQPGLKNPVLSHARKWHWATLRIRIVSSAGRSTKKSKTTYAFWQTNNGIHCAVTLEEVVTVWVVVLAHQLDSLLRARRAAFRNLPTSGRGNVRNRTDRAPLCARRHMMSVKGMGESDVLGISRAQTDNLQRSRGTSVCRHIPGAFSLGARNGPIVHGKCSLARGENKSEAECCRRFHIKGHFEGRIRLIWNEMNEGVVKRTKSRDLRKKAMLGGIVYDGG